MKRKKLLNGLTIILDDIEDKWYFDIRTPNSLYYSGGYLSKENYPSADDVINSIINDYQWNSKLRLLFQRVIFYFRGCVA